jgi:pyrroline-5-carboxylate reductase
MKELFTQRVAIIGAGNIGRIILERLRRSGMTVRMAVFDKDSQKAQSAAAQVGAEVLSELEIGRCGAQLWLLCMGPKAVLPFLKQFSPCLQPGHIVVSFAAAVPLDSLKSLVSEGVHMVRVMPNMPSQVGEGMNPVCFSEKVPPEAREIVMQLLEGLGETVEVSDEQMNWCVGLSGAAMRSLIPVIEGMINAGHKAGLSTKKARKIAAQVMLGTAELVAQLDETSLADIKALTLMETVDEGQVAQIFEDAASGAKAKIDRLQAAILSEN